MKETSLFILSIVGGLVGITVFVALVPWAFYLIGASWDAVDKWTCEKKGMNWEYRYGEIAGSWFVSCVK